MSDLTIDAPNSTIQRKVNKSAVVRKILEDIGAMSETVPRGWRNKVQELLQEQNLQMHPNYISVIRRNAVQSARKSAARSKKAVRNSAAQSVASTRHVSKRNSEQTVSNLKSVLEFSKKFGGLDALSQAIDTIKSFRD